MHIGKYIKSKFDLNKPDFAKHEDWENFYANARIKQPIVYFITEYIPNKAKRCKNWYYNSVYYYIAHRTFDKYHIVDTGLKPGYMDCDLRMIHVIFNLLVEFIEIEYSNWQIDSGNFEKYPVPWWGHWPASIRIKRNPQAGVDYLKKEVILNSSSEDTSIQEIWELYHWWKYVRPNRPRPSDISGWNEWSRSHKGQRLFDDDYLTPDELIFKRDLLEESNRISQSYNQEDDDMSVRLMRVRRNLWT